MKDHRLIKEWQSETVAAGDGTPASITLPRGYWLERIELIQGGTAIGSSATAAITFRDGASTVPAVTITSIAAGANAAGIAARVVRPSYSFTAAGVAAVAGTAAAYKARGSGATITLTLGATVAGGGTLRMTVFGTNENPA